MAYKAYADSDTPMYKHLSLCVYHAHYGDSDRALEHLELFSQQPRFNYLLIPFLQIDPLTDPLRGLPRYLELISRMEEKIRMHQEVTRRSLEEKNLI